jgi:O-antigen ligase
MFTRSVALTQSLSFVLAGALLAAIPFRWTVDKRGGILALLVLILLVQAARAGTFRAFLPASRTLAAAALFWLGAAFFSAVTGQQPFEGLRSVRSDVLGPILAFCAFFFLTRDKADLFRWAVICAAAQIALAVLMVADPYRPDPSHRPAYVDAGVASCWLVICAAWLPVLWSAPERHRRWARPLALVHLCTLFAASLASYNRLVWICYAVMVAAGACAWLRVGNSPVSATIRWRIAAGAAATIVLLVGMAWHATGARAQSYNATNNGSPAYVLQDPRLWIWPAGLKMAAERPLAGYGFGTEHWKDEFTRRNGTEHTNPRINHAHNAILNNVLQIGIAGGVAVLYLFGALLGLFAGRNGEGVWAVAAAGGAAVVAGFFVRNLTDDYFLRQSLMLFGAVAGAFAGALRTPARDVA